MTAYILLNVDSRAIGDTVFTTQGYAEAAAAELGVSWVIVERELEAAPAPAPTEPPAVTE